MLVVNSVQCVYYVFTKREGVVGYRRLTSQVAQNVLRIAVPCAPLQVRPAEQTALLQFCPIIENLLGENSGGESGEH